MSDALQQIVAITVAFGKVPYHKERAVDVESVEVSFNSV